MTVTVMVDGNRCQQRLLRENLLVLPYSFRFVFLLKRVRLSQNVALGSPASGSPGNSPNYP